MLDYLLGAFLATAVGFAIAAGKKRFGRHAGDSWSSTRATIEHGELHYENRGKVTVPVAQLSYSYQYEG